MQPNPESKANYQIVNRNSAYTTCRMLTELFNQGVGVITDLTSAVVNSSLAPGLARTLTQRDYDPIAGVNIPGESSTRTTEYQQTEGHRNSPKR